jgi:nucleoredoxin
MASLLAGRKLITKSGADATPGALDGKVVLLYFSASWCPPCHGFTPVLADFYDEVGGSGGNLEIVYVPSDRTRGEMMEYFNDLHGNWLALDMGDRAAIEELKAKYQVRGIPSLVAVQADGTVIDAGCREQVQSRGPAAFQAWRAAWKSPAFSGVAHQLGGGGPSARRLVTDHSVSSRSPIGKTRASNGWAIGDLCEVEGKGPGVVQFVGQAAPTGGRRKFFLGIELEYARGTHDGALFGTRYFTCKSGHGLMTSKLETVKFLREAYAAPKEYADPAKIRYATRGGGSSAVPEGVPSRSRRHSGRRDGDSAGLDTSMSRHRPAAQRREAERERAARELAQQRTAELRRMDVQMDAQMVAHFMTIIVGASETTARRTLESVDWDLQRALDQHLRQHQEPEPGPEPEPEPWQREPDHAARDLARERSAQLRLEAARVRKARVDARRQAEQHRRAEAAYSQEVHEAMFALDRNYSSGGTPYLKRHTSSDMKDIKLSTVQCSGDYRDCDERALSAREGAHWRTVEELAQHLTQPFHGDHEKMARVLFRWVAQNVAYNVRALRSGTITHEICQAEYVMRHGLAVCSGYATLLCALCDAVGVPCKKINGKGKPEPIQGHAWNALSFDGERGWHLCDACWAAGGVGGDTFTRSWTKYWWCTPPQYFIELHLPEDPNHQLLDRPVSETEWVRMKETQWMPTIFSGVDGVDFLSPSTGTLQRGQRVEFRIFLAEDSPSILKLQWGEELGETLRSQRDRGGYVHSITVQARNSGTVNVIKQGPTRQTLMGTSTRYDGLARWKVE